MEEPDPIYDHHRKKILVAGLAITAVCTQLATIMTMETDHAEKEIARWNEEETQQFIQFLVDHKSEGGNIGRFKNKTMTAAAEHIAPYRDMGVVKEAKHLHTKWNTVNDHSSWSDHRSLLIQEL